MNLLIDGHSPIDLAILTDNANWIKRLLKSYPEITKSSLIKNKDHIKDYEVSQLLKQVEQN